MIFSGKTIKVILSAEAAEEYNLIKNIVENELKKEINSSISQSIFRSMERVCNWLKENPFVGNQLKRGQIPKYYIQNYDVMNLWRIELSNYWRLIYTIQSNEVEIINFVLDIIDHKRYDKIFGYDKK